MCRHPPVSTRQYTLCPYTTLFRSVGRGTTYAETLAGLGWTPVMLRVNTGRAIRDNGVELAALLRTLVAEWPGGVERVALIGHSMGGLIARAGCSVVTDEEEPGTERRRVGKDGVSKCRSRWSPDH